MTASPLVEVQYSSDPGIWHDTPSGVNVGAGDTVQIRLKTPFGVSKWFLKIFGVDEVLATPPVLAGVTGGQVDTTSTVVTFTLPTLLPGAGLGLALVFKSSVDSGGAGLISTFGIYTLTIDGFRVGAVGERLEGDPDFGWIRTVNAFIRAGGGGGVVPTLPDEAVIIGTPFGNAVRQLTEDDILPGFSIASFTPAGTNYATVVELGVNISAMTATATYVSGPPSAGTISNSTGGSVGGTDISPAGWTFLSPFAAGTMAGSITRSGIGAAPTWTITLSATGPAGPRTSAITVTWLPLIFHGAHVVGTYNAAFITGLASSALQASRVTTYTDNAGPAQFLYYAIPSSYGTPTFHIGGFDYPGTLVAAAVAVTNAHAVVRNYDLWQVVATPNLGSTTVSVT